MSLTTIKKIAPLAVLALTVLAAACGGGGAKTVNTAANSAANSGSSSGAGTGSGRPAPPGVSGTIAAVNGTTLEVQGASSQTTVKVTPTTTIPQTVAGAASDLAVGACVTATGSRSSTSAPVAATTVTINEMLSGSDNCTGGAGGGFFGGGGGGGFGGGGFRTGGPEGGGTANATRTTLSPAQRAARAAQLAKVGIASGRVTTISGQTVDLAVPTPSSTSTTNANTATRPRFTPSSVFTFSSSTKFSKTESATASALTVNACVTAFGPSDDTGAVTATRIMITPPVNGSCNTGFGGRGFGGFFRGGAGGAAGAPGAGA